MRRRELGLVVVYACVLLLLALAAPRFFAADNLRDLLVGHAPMLVAATGMTLVVVAGEFGRTVGNLNGQSGRDHFAVYSAVFAGGGDHTVLAAAIRLASPRKVVVTLAAVQRVGETAALLTASGYQAEGVQLQASRLTPLPAGQHRLAAQNPVFVLWGRR